MGNEARADTSGVRILHTSDVHIGHTKGLGDAHSDVCQCPILGLTAAAVKHQADALIIAGDLFDHARLSDETIVRTLELLTAPGVPVIVIPGNHDVHDATSLWERCRTDVERTGVLLLDRLVGSSLVLASGRLTVWGRAMADHEPGYRPLAEVPPRPDTQWYVVAAHGHLNLTADDAHRSSPITYEEIAATDADYVALGHWHVTTDASHGGVVAWYPGAPMGQPGSGTAVLATLDHEVTIEHVNISSPENGCL
ncbi:MAG: DNA repair exonuclease [Actinomycetota bacterium]|nr:DNA repair exonuclease [Actinomycetota bacterium]